jgi:Cytochrome c5
MRTRRTLLRRILEVKTVFRPRTLSVLLASLVAAAVGLFSATGAFAALEDQIRARLQSPTEVCVVGDECAAGLKLPGAAAGPTSPEEVYTTYCSACHNTGLNNAPAFGNAEAWEPRIAKGVEELYNSAVNGFNNGAMPPKGTCMSCSDEVLHATVDYILESL